MKNDIHPEYKPLTIKIGSDVFTTNSTRGGEILMEIDYRKHSAWTKDNSNLVNQANRNISNFNKKFAGLKFGSK
jgi:large subunit ribosomal protein L31